jgi:hypothetical protein
LRSWTAERRIRGSGQKSRGLGQRREEAEVQDRGGVKQWFGKEERRRRGLGQRRGEAEVRTAEKRSRGLGQRREEAEV